MKNIPKGILKDFVATGRRVAECGLVLCGSGNLSWRVDDECMLITAMQSWMVSLSTDEVAVCRIADGASLDGKNPSKEIGFHASILRGRRDVNVVLHFQSPCASTVACWGRQVESFSVIPEIPYYIGPVEEVPYLLPGSTELAEAVTAASMEHDLVILRNHGQVTVGQSFDEAIEKATYFELACKIILKAGGDVQLLSKEAIADMRRARAANGT